MEHKYKPRGVCSYEMKIEIEENIIRKVIIEGGCAGNTIGISRLVEGMELDEAIKRSGRFDYKIEIQMKQYKG